MASFEFKEKEYSNGWAKGMYPSPENPGIEKPDTYYLAKARHLYSMYCYGGCQIAPGGVRAGQRSISTLRKYSMGVQDTAHLRSIVDCDLSGGNPNGQREWLMNISWQPPGFFPKFRDVAVAKITELDRDPVVRASDRLSTEMRRQAILNDKLLSDPRMKTLVESTGASPKYSNPTAKGMNAADIDTFAELGGYALPGEALMQDILQVGLDLAGYKDTQWKMAEDFYDLGIAAARVHWDTFDDRLGLKYIDPAGLIVPPSNRQDATDIPFFATIETETLQSLRRECVLGEKTWYLIAKMYSNYGENNSVREAMPNFNSMEFREDFLAKHGAQAYDCFRLKVMSFWFIESDDISGASVQTVYKAKWIVGTDVVFDYGEDNTVCRTGGDGKRRAMLPLVMSTAAGMSVTERCIADIDDVCIAVFKMRALIAGMPTGPRMIVDIAGLLDTITIGGRNYTFQELLGAYSSTGVLVVQSSGEYTDVGTVNGAAKNPITFVPPGIESDFNLLLTRVNAGLEAIRQSTGINEVSDGTANPNDMLNGVMNGLLNSSNVSLKRHTNVMESLFVQTIRLFGRKIQAAALHSPVTFSMIPASSSTIKMLTLDGSQSFFDYEFSCRPLPTADEINMMTQMILARVSENKLSQADMLVAMTMLRDSRNVKMAMIYVTRAVAEREAQERAAQQQAIAAQSQAQAAAAASMEEEKRKTSQAESAGKMEIERLKGMNKLEAIRLQGEIDAKIALLSSGARAVENQYQSVS